MSPIEKQAEKAAREDGVADLVECKSDKIFLMCARYSGSRLFLVVVLIAWIAMCAATTSMIWRADV